MIRRSHAIHRVHTDGYLQFDKIESIRILPVHESIAGASLVVRVKTKIAISL